MSEATTDTVVDDAETFARVKARYLRGVPANREMMADEIGAVIRHAMRLEYACAVQDAELHRIGLEAMDTSPDPMRRD